MLTTWERGMLSALLSLAFIATHGQPISKNIYALKFATTIRTII